MKAKIKNQANSLRLLEKIEVNTRRCNLCSEPFQIKTRFERYCHRCRGQSELLKFSDWLPELDPTLELELIA